MSMLTTFLLLHVFTAVLPSKDDDEKEDEYYRVLGFSSRSRRISMDEIRKAYRSLSLELHPDKIAQRRSGDAEAAAARYEKVQQAYAVLSDENERSKYHSVNCSVARYKFLYHQGWMHPMDVLKNVAKANFFDKLRLVIVVLIVVSILLIQPVLIAAKVNAQLYFLEGDHKLLYNTPWNLIFIPFYVMYGSYTLVLFGIFLLMRQRDALFDFLQNSCIIAGVALLAWQWDQAKDRPRDSVNWFMVATPFYLAVGFKLAAISERTKALQRILLKMVSPDQWNKLAAQQQPPPDGETTLHEEQLEELRRQYVVVMPNDLIVMATLALMAEQGHPTLSDDELEALKVQSSAEFLHVNQQINESQMTMLNALIYSVTMISLIAAKCENLIHASWWVVFIPLWIYLGTTFLSSCCVCVFVGAKVSDEEPVVVVESESQQEQAAQEEEDPSENDSRPASSPQTEDDSKINSPKSPYSESRSPPTQETVSEQPSTPTEESLDSPVTPKASPETPKSPASSTPVAKSTTFVKQSNTYFRKQRSQQDEGEEEEKQDGSQHEEEEQELGDEHDDGIPELDAEESFRQWQQQHAKEEDHAATEKAVNAQGTCCKSVFQIVTLCLAVAKLEDAYDVEDGNIGFNTFWILFPVFFLGFIMLCCCCCLIYCAPRPESMEEMLQNNNNNNNNASEQEGQHSDVEQANGDVVIPEPVDDEQQQPQSQLLVVEPSLPNNTTTSNNNNNNNPPATGDINDLD